jgi:hypothetical protein
MKKILISACVLLTAFLLTTCNRDVNNLTGDYSYKLSGEVIITDDDGDETHHFIHRNGQMNVLKDKSRKSGLVITMNEMNGGCYTLLAELQGDTIVLQPHQFTTTLLSTEGIPSIGQEGSHTMVYQISAAGNGRPNDQMLILREHWTGNQSSDASVRLHAPEITILAEKN